MTKIRQYVSFVMAVIIMNSAFNPYSVYADELSSESGIEQSETEQPTQIESVTEAESEIESETASEADTEPENDGIYNDAEYIDDLMINDIAVYSNSRPKGDGREPSGGSLSGGGHGVKRSGGGHGASSGTSATASTDKFLQDMRNDLEDTANFLENIRYKLGAINNNLCDSVGYLWDISMAIERVSSSVSTCANWLAKSKDVLDSIHSDILQSNVLIASINVYIGNINKSLTSFVTSFDLLKENGLKDTSGTWIAQQVYNLKNLVDSVLIYVKGSNTIIGKALKNESGVWLIEYAERTFTYVYQLYTNFDLLKENGLKDTSGTWIAQQVYNLKNLVDSVLIYVKGSNTIIGKALKNESGVWLIEYAERTFTHVYQLYTNFNSAFMVGDEWIGSYVVNIYFNVHDLYKIIKEYLPSVDTWLSRISYFTSSVVKALSDGNGTILNTVRDIKKLLSELNSKFDKLITAVKELNQKVVVIDNSDRTKSDDEEENSSLFDLVTMVMYSVFILASLLDLLLLLLEYVVLMFQIPAVPALMNENVLLGWNYANAICIPGTEFSIVSFLRLLMYITVIFSAIKVIKKAIDNGSIGVI